MKNCIIFVATLLVPLAVQSQTNGTLADSIQADSVQAESASQPALTIGGYIKNLNGMIAMPEEEWMHWGLLHGRLNVKWEPLDWFTGAVELRHRIYYGNAVNSNLYSYYFIDSKHKPEDLSDWPFGISSAKVMGSIERLWGRFAYEDYELTVGRQRINWGVNLVWNPNDIFNTYSFVDFDYEERPGADAVRLRMNTGELSSIEVACKFTDTSTTNVYAAQYRSNYQGYDYQAIAGYFRDEFVLGAGWAGSIGDVGFKGEGSYFHPTTSIDDTSGILAATVELDYTIGGSVYLCASYLFNSSVQPIPDSGFIKMLNIGADVSSKTLSPTNHTAFLQIRSIASPVFSAGVSAMYFFELDGLYVFPTISYAFADAWELSAFLQSFAVIDSGSDNMIHNASLRLKFSF